MNSIRSEESEDQAEIRSVTIDAFTNCELGYHGEADLVDELRVRCAKNLSLVACVKSEVVGHILFTPVVIRAEEHAFHGMGLAPLSVATAFQNRGIGSSLVTAGLERLGDEKCPFVVVLGHAEYYSSFGFRPASQYGVRHGFAGISQSVFLIRLLEPQALQFKTGGFAYYRPEFGRQSERT